MTLDDLPAMIRMFRARRRMSQREFAALAGVPRSTIDRLEAGRCEPRLSTLLRLAALAECSLEIVDADGRPVAPDAEHEALTDGADRHFPAHLPAGEVWDYYAREGRNWWGWERIAWPGDRVPRYTFWRRPTRRPTTRPPTTMPPTTMPPTNRSPTGWGIDGT